jgi:hypothetical protein
VDPAVLIFAVLLAGISPFAILAIASPIAYRNIGRWLMLVPVMIVALGMFGTVVTANDSNGFGQIAAFGMIYLGILLGIAMLGAFALFGFVNRKLGKVKAGNHGQQISRHQSQPKTKSP